MDKKRSLLPSKRRLIQLYCALLYNAHLRGFIQGDIYRSRNITTKALCVPGLNCYSCPGAVGACPLGSLQNAVSASGKQAGFYVFGILMLYGLMLGRTICGWLCPFGLVQELLHKIPTPKIKKSRITRALSYLKYIILFVFVFAVTAWYGIAHGVAVPAFCKYICPAGTFGGALPLLANPANGDFFSMLGSIFTNKFVIMVLILLLCIFCYRSFCRFLCPLGAIYGFFSRIAVVGVKVDSSRCNGCGNCVRNCQMDVRHVGDHECIHCGKCIQSCPEQALSLKAGRFTLVSSEGKTCGSKKATAVRAVALAVLCFALLWFNVLDPEIRAKEVKSEEPVAVQAAEEPVYESSAPAGNTAGCLLPDFSITCMDGSVFKLSENRGKPVIINLWATWCGPCVNEIPHFSELYDKYEGEIEILMLHSDIITDDPEDFVQERGKNWKMRFAVETDDEVLWDLLGALSALPQTVVLNRYGEVIYNQCGSVTPELLQTLYEQASEIKEGNSI
ncbi:MAG: 4Fe-4S binding protein [Sphaerochaetaceae bacterium]|nr:4Fe-4S binding protein [Sphaerochaetaceae bacterium]